MGPARANTPALAFPCRAPAKIRRRQCMWTASAPLPCGVKISPASSRELSMTTWRASIRRVLHEMSQTLQAIRGMNDILPVDAELWEQFEELVRDWLHAYGYRPIRMPIVEPTPLFARAIGEMTDIVEKEMYSFTDALNGEELTLRPEGTASCVRAVLQHNLLYDGPKRLWYMGPMFRHERPQKGRYRQFHQVGVEALGFAGPDVDAEQILMR